MTISNTFVPNMPKIVNPPLLKDPYQEKELDYTNECEPFGNPFKLLRIKQEKRNNEVKSEVKSDAYLT